MSIITGPGALFVFPRGLNSKEKSSSVDVPMTQFKIYTYTGNPPIGDGNTQLYATASNNLSEEQRVYLINSHGAIEDGDKVIIHANAYNILSDAK